MATLLRSIPVRSRSRLGRTWLPGGPAVGGAADSGKAKATILQACDHKVLTWANVAAAANMRTYLA
jgi:hypothetical protein